jgi:GNAT superfamily N-acetyltransferase
MPETETGRHRSEVGRLLVSTSFRKRGIARVLMGMLEGEARSRGRWMVVSFSIFLIVVVVWDAMCSVC